MELEPFDEDLRHRDIVPYSPVYGDIFQMVRDYVTRDLSDVDLVHIGSTAISDLRGKPMIDLLAVTERENLRMAQVDLEELGFHRRKVWVDRDDKPYVCGSLTHLGKRYNINIHVCHIEDPTYTDAMSFMGILRDRPDLRRKYEAAKDHAHDVEPENAERYNREKESVIRSILELASSSQTVMSRRIT